MNGQLENRQGDQRWGAVYYANVTSEQAKGLTDAAFRLWILLHTYVNRNTGGWAVSAERLSEDTGYSRSTVFRALKSLKASKLVLTENHGRCNRYVLVNAGTQNENTGVNIDTPAVSPGDTPAVSPGDTHTQQLTENYTEPPLTPPKGGDLAGFLGRILDELLQELETKKPIEAAVFLKGEPTAYSRYFMEFWNLRETFSEMCEQTKGYDPIACHVAAKIEHLIPPESGRQRSAAKRLAFLTECQEAIREYGRQL